MQLKFGWNNQVLQQQASNVTFFYSATDSYDAECEWFTGPVKNRKSHTVTKKTATSVISAVERDVRVRNQITGFTLKGLGESSTTGNVPEVNGACLGEGTDGTWVSVNYLGSTGGLYVSYDRNDHLISPA